MTGIVNGAAGLFANAGVAVVITSATTARLVRLSDGWGWPIDAEPGDLFWRTIWVDDNEVWLATAPLQWNGSYKNGMIRLKRADLGPPTIAPN